MIRKILVVDDVAVNREILKRILSDDYEVLLAENGQEALDILAEQFESISVLLLDILMPIKDGYDVLKQMRADPALDNIPVIVTTASTDEGAELKALELGANDYITKPYNPISIKHRVKNTVNLRESAAIANLVKKDELTGLYNRRGFFEAAEELISKKEPGYYVMACFDVNNFKVINDQYGSIKGDDVLRRIGIVLMENFDPEGGICGRITADNFAVLYPKALLNSEFLPETRHKLTVLDGSIPPISFSVGRYVVDDPDLPVSGMYDRAALAEASVKKRYDLNVATYDEEMRLRLLNEQSIVNEMKAALENNNFEIWLQPQYNHATGAVVGSEALVRWRHPEKGLIPPGVFIPIFEKNGFVYEVDKFVWESACKYIRKRLDSGKSSLPVSVNISRYDLFRSDVIDVLTGLIEKYEVPTDKLRLEITESAFSESASHINNIVKQFVEMGFTVEIDDFGSGYSSLNTLKDVPAEVLKLDMRFLEVTDNSDRGGNILESIVRMAKWIGMSVIAEGVETIEQADYLKSVGCSYVQGYLYARPMPIHEFEALRDGVATAEKTRALETVENMDNNSFWNPASIDTLMFNSYVGGACILEYHHGKIELLRVNAKFVSMLGADKLSVNEVLAVNWQEHLSKDGNSLLKSALDKSISTGEEVSGEYEFSALPGRPETTYLKIALRIIAKTSDRFMAYCLCEDITPQKLAEQLQREGAEQLRAITENINGGVTATVITDAKTTNFIFANDRYYEQLGYTKEQYKKELSSPFDPLHPLDRARVIEETIKGNRSSKPFMLRYRIITRDGIEKWMVNNISIVNISGISGPVQIAVSTDISVLIHAQAERSVSDERFRAIMDNIGSGITASIYNPEGSIGLLFANKRFYQITGYTKEEFDEKFENILGPVYPEDINAIYAWAQKAATETGDDTIEYRIVRKDGSIIWIRHRITNTDFTGIDVKVQLSIYIDVTATRTALQNERNISERLETIMKNINSGVAVIVMGEVGRQFGYMNDRFAEIFGYTREQFDAEIKTSAELVHPDDRTKMNLFATHVRSGVEHEPFEYRAIKRDGSVIYIRSSLSRASVAGIGENALLSVVTDITSEKQILAELQASKRILEMAGREANVSVWLLNLDSRSIDHAFTGSSIEGLPKKVSNMPESMIDNDLIAPESVEAFRSLYYRMYDGAEKGSAKIYVRNLKFGGYEWINITYNRLYDSHFTGRVAVGICQKVDE